MPLGGLENRPGGVSTSQLLLFTENSDWHVQSFLEPEVIFTFP